MPSIDVPEHRAAMPEQPFKKTPVIPAAGIEKAQTSATGWFSLTLTLD
jgi:hypothetical protein